MSENILNINKREIVKIIINIYDISRILLDTTSSFKIQKKNNGIKNRKTAFSTGLTPGPLIRFI